MAVIAVDVDGVLADFCGGFADYVSRRTGKSRSTLPNPTSWNFWGEWGLTEAATTIHLKPLAVTVVNNGTIQELGLRIDQALGRGHLRARA